MITIREARSEDAAAIAYVHICSWREIYIGLVSTNYLMNLSYEEQTATWSNVLKSVNSITYVAVNERKQVIGFASSGIKQDGTTDNRQGEIYGVHLLKSHIQCGIGQQLVYAIIDHFLEMNVNIMTTWVLVDDYAIGFYESIGGQVIDKKSVVKADTELCEVCYGWDNLRSILSQPIEMMEHLPEVMFS